MEQPYSFNVSGEATEAVVRELGERGWSVESSDDVKAKIAIQLILSDLQDTSTVADCIEAELLNSDLRSVDSNSLPDAKALRKTSYIQGPKVLQIMEARDIAVGSVEGFSQSSKRRLLRLVLTDGKNEIVAIEFSPLPSIPTDVVPGTKIRLQKKIPVRCGIACLHESMVALLGGVVQSLHEEWMMNQKYRFSTTSSSNLQKHGGADGGAPPTFEKLEIGKSSQAVPRQDSSVFTSGTAYAASSSRSQMPTSKMNFRDENHDGNKQRVWRDKGKAASEIGQRVAFDEEENQFPSSKDSALNECSASTAPHEGETAFPKVPETAAIQNQEAAQKLLQKMSNRRGTDLRRRGRTHGVNRRQDQGILTLDEWEKRKHGEQMPSAIDDEEFAKQLQNQLDLEDSHEQWGSSTAADDIKRSIFFSRGEANSQNEDRGRRRGRGYRRSAGRGGRRGGR